MTSDLGDFAQQHNIDKLARCTKADLLLVSNFLHVGVSLNARKPKIKQCLSEQLVERGIIGKTKPQMFGASGDLVVEVEAKAATTIPEVFSGRMTTGVEAPSAIQRNWQKELLPNVDLASLLQAGMVTEDLKLALHLKEVELETKTKEVELMHLIRVMELDPSRNTMLLLPLRVRPLAQFPLMSSMQAKKLP